MKKSLAAFLALSFLLSACGAIPGLGRSEGSTPTAISQADLEATSAVFVQQTLNALPTNTTAPSETPVIIAPTKTATATATQPTPTETGVPALLTLTATLNAALTTPGTAASNPVVGTIPATATIEAQPLTHGTLPPNLPYGTINLFNKAHVDVYISLRCVTKEGYVTLLEYPVKKTYKVSAPAGKYTYVAWVGGRQFDGSFSLEQDGYMTITFFKERINVKKN
jgi:predicted small secreted protein